MSDPLWKVVMKEDTTLYELRQAVLEYMAREQDHKLHNELFCQVIVQYSQLTKQLEEQMQAVLRMSVTDGLTGVYNRKKFNEVLPGEISRAERYNTPMSIVMLDIDHFKKVNDTFGHETGDSVLVELARLVETSLRGSDLFVRWGGEEFLILTPQTDGVQAWELAERVRHNVATYPFSRAGYVTISLGVAEFHRGKEPVTALLARADAALYKAKAEGRNRVVFLEE